MANVLPANPSILGHIFRYDEGHLPDSAANRHFLVTLANDEAAYYGTDRYKTSWYVRMQPDGRQAWVQTRNGVIIEGGLNRFPKRYNIETGLKRP